MRSEIIFYLIVFIVLLTGCRENCHGGKALDDIESYIEYYPDSALTSLRNIEYNILNTRYLKARHALLHSIALDKNYIDLTTDSIIAPALMYFNTKGTPDERLKSKYYQARICMNAGSNESAMELLVAATAINGKITDKSSLARCWSAIGMLHIDQFDYYKAIESYSISSDLFLESGNINSYYVCIQ